jgi:hypothetical protein
MFVIYAILDFIGISIDVPLDKLAGFNRVASITTDIKRIAAALKHSELLQV